MREIGQTNTNRQQQIPFQYHPRRNYHQLKPASRPPHPEQSFEHLFTSAYHADSPVKNHRSMGLVTRRQRQLGGGGAAGGGGEGGAGGGWPSFAGPSLEHPVAFQERWVKAVSHQTAAAQASSPLHHSLGAIILEPVEYRGLASRGTGQGQGGPQPVVNRPCYSCSLRESRDST